MLHECVPCARAHVYVYTCDKHTRATSTCAVCTNTASPWRAGCAERKRERGREGDRRWCESEEPATEKKWGQGGPGCEGERRRERETRGTDVDGGRREREGEGTVGGGRILTERWGMSRRVVCSHGSSLGTAVQYAGQGKVTLLCVRARARVRASQCPPPQSPLLTLARARTYTSSLYSRRPLSRRGSIIV